MYLFFPLYFKAAKSVFPIMCTEVLRGAHKCITGPSKSDWESILASCDQFPLSPEGTTFHQENVNSMGLGHIPGGNAHILNLGKEAAQCSGHRNTFFGDLKSIIKLTLTQKEYYTSQSLENLETSLSSKFISVPWVGFEQAPATVGWGSPGSHWELWGCVRSEGADESHSRLPILGF